jgi:hypothetical protein
MSAQARCLFPAVTGMGWRGELRMSRMPRKLVQAGPITLGAGQPGAAASASVRTFPRLILVRLADLAATFAMQAIRFNLSCSARASSLDFFSAHPRIQCQLCPFVKSLKLRETVPILLGVKKR